MSRAKIFWISFLVFVALVPALQQISSATLIILFLGSFFLRPGHPFQNYLQSAWDTWLYLVMLILGLLYTDSLEAGMRVLETSLSLFVLTFIFEKLKPFDKQKLYAVLWVFAGGLLVAFLYCLSFSVYRYLGSHNVTEFFGDNLTSALDNVHPIYFGYYVITVITFGLYLIYNQEKTVVSMPVTLAITVFFFIMLLLIDSSTAIVGVLFPLLYFTLKFVYEDRRVMSHYIAFSASVLFLVCLFAANNLNLPGGNVTEDYWERYVLWESALHALPDWLIGVGTGDASSVLNEYYRMHNLSAFAASNYNAHNQFIETLFEVGIPGLAVMIILIGRPIYMAVQTQNIFGFLCIFPFLIYGMTEVFLGRYQGVVFFSLLHHAFISLLLQQRSELALKVGKI